MIIGLSWSEIKSTVAIKNLTWQYDEVRWEDSYHIFAVDGPIVYETRVFKDEGEECTDFETNYKSLANWAIGTRNYAFATGDFDFAGDGVFDTCTASQTKTIDYTFSEDLYVNGGNIVLEGSVLGDWVEVHVNHPTYGNIKTYLKKRYVPASPVGQATPLLSINTAYAGKVLTGLRLRLIYHSTGSTDVKIAVNYDLHKPI